MGSNVFLRNISGIKVANTELEYDIMVILKDESKCLEREVVRPGYSKIRPKSKESMKMCRWGEKMALVDDQYVSTDKIIRWFYGEMKKCRDKQLTKDEVS